MKKLLFLTVALSSAMGVSAQYHYQDSHNPDLARHTLREVSQRTEFILPQVNGYNIYKADLHTHTIYSDGSCTPEFRVREAWHDGLDVIAVTEHLEYRPYEEKLVTYLKGYVPEGTKAHNHKIATRPADKEGIQVDLNYPVELAKQAAKGYGLTVVPGVEITRDQKEYGHYNALFTKDNNTIYDPDPLQAFRNARAQGALVMHNHPGWSRKSVDHPEFELKAYGEGLIDGVEVMNGPEFYPKIITRAHQKNLFVSSNTDMHDSSAETFRVNGHRRNMTFILAKDNTLESLREAIDARRTLAYAYGTLAGEEQLLKDFFLATIQTTIVNTNDKGTRTVRLTNNSSMEYIIRFPNQNPIRIKPFTSFHKGVKKDATLSFTVESMYSSEDKHPVIEIKL